MLLVYEQNVKADTINMSDIIFVSNYQKQNSFNSPICIVGSYVLALLTETILPKDIVILGDEAFTKFHKNKNFLKLIENIFSFQSVNNIIEMIKTKLKVD